jgi:predicted metal-dependent phosphoesterase TrpH
MDVLKVDLHLHTGEDPIDRILHSASDLVNRAAELGFDALAITLHDSQFADSRVSALARERGITLIPGIERTIAGRHVLLLNFPAGAAEPVRTMDDVARLKARHGGLVIAPHPYFPDRSCLRGALEAHADLFDAVEWSYFWTRGVNFNARAARWARMRGKPLVGNSDLHDLRQLGRTCSLVDAASREPSAICDAIRQGRVTLQTEPAPVLELADVFSRMILRSRKNSPPAQPFELRHPSKRPCRTSAMPFVRSASSPYSPSSRS